MKITDKFVFFWGDKDVFSNFFQAHFKHQDIIFKNSETAIMYRKAMLFGEEDIAKQILNVVTPKRAKELGRSIKSFDNAIWEANREIIFKEVLYDKFKNPDMRKRILRTYGKILVEASPYDKIWGIGMDANHPDVENPSKWKGLNLLGKVLMEVREQLI